MRKLSFEKSIIGKGSIIHLNVSIKEYVVIGHNGIIGYPKEAAIEKLQSETTSKYPFSLNLIHRNRTTIDKRCRIGSNVVIYEGAKIGENVSIDDNCRIGFDTQIGNGTRILYGAFVCDQVKIGHCCKVAGFVCDRASIGNYSSSFGDLVHKYREPETWGLNEPSPVIEDHVVIGYNATVVGGVTIGHNSYVAAGAVVTKDVLPNRMVIGINRTISSKEWCGKMGIKPFWGWGVNER